MRQTQAIKCFTEEHIKITQEVTDFLNKGVIVETLVSTRSYVSQIFLVEKKGGQRPVINLKGLNSFIKVENERPSSPSRSGLVSGLDSEVGLERCLPTGPNSPGTLMSPPIPLGEENIPICMSSLWPNISTPGVYQDNETSSGCTEIDENSSHNLLGR